MALKLLQITMSGGDDVNKRNFGFNEMFSKTRQTGSLHVGCLQSHGLPSENERSPTMMSCQGRT